MTSPTSDPVTPDRPERLSDERLDEAILVYRGGPEANAVHAYIASHETLAALEELRESRRTSFNMVEEALDVAEENIVGRELNARLRTEVAYLRDEINGCTLAEVQFERDRLRDEVARQSSLIGWLRGFALKAHDAPPEHHKASLMAIATVVPGGSMTDDEKALMDRIGLAAYLAAHPEDGHD